MSPEPPSLWTSCLPAGVCVRLPHPLPRDRVCVPARVRGGGGGGEGEGEPSLRQARNLGCNMIPSPVISNFMTLRCHRRRAAASVCSCPMSLSPTCPVLSGPLSRFRERKKIHLFSLHSPLSLTPALSYTCTTAVTQSALIACRSPTREAQRRSKSNICSNQRRTQPHTPISKSRNAKGGLRLRAG